MTRTARLPCHECGRMPKPGDDQGDWYATRSDLGDLAVVCPTCDGRTVREVPAVPLP